MTIIESTFLCIGLAAVVAVLFFPWNRGGNINQLPKGQRPPKPPPMPPCAPPRAPGLQRCTRCGKPCPTCQLEDADAAGVAVREPAPDDLESFMREEVAKTMRGEDTALRRWAEEVRAGRGAELPEPPPSRIIREKDAI
jgi:hypothetical protein